MSVRVFYGGRPAAAPDPADRGLAYGDGLFETVRYHTGRPVWWERHWHRLAEGAGRLGIPLPDPHWLRAQADASMAGDGVLRLVLTRGPGTRGYAPPRATTPGVILSRHPPPPPPRPGGLCLRWCRTRLAAQPALAGLKHLNRLEQVLARAEWQDEGIDEGLLCDGEGRVVSAIAGNLFVRLGGRWLTPRLDRCGVAGVCRAWLLEELDAGEAEIAPQQVEAAGALFVCNSVRGILPVAALGDRRWPPDAAVDGLRRRLARVEPAFSPSERESR